MGLVERQQPLVLDDGLLGQFDVRLPLSPAVGGQDGEIQITIDPGPKTRPLNKQVEIPQSRGNRLLEHVLHGAGVVNATAAIPLQRPSERVQVLPKTLGLGALSTHINPQEAGVCRCSNL
jgi:hypothetical protein